jgi:hypothetical protein
MLWDQKTRDINIASYQPAVKKRKFLEKILKNFIRHPQLASRTQ